MQYSPDHDGARDEITPRELYLNRRQIMAAGGAALLGAAGLGQLLTAVPARAGQPLKFTADTAFSTNEARTDFDQAANYCNFYEFTTDKDTVGAKAKGLRLEPWQVSVSGLVRQPGQFAVSELMEKFPLEERVYRLRCVEGWSMVIPWIGFPLASLLSQVQPTEQAKFVEFTTLHDPAQMPGQKRGVLPWPYVEGLRLDEALHPLTILAVGMYGEALPQQNGAPIRLVVPWKYGFKYCKSLVSIRLTEEMPRTSWVRANAVEYGFYANVNPAVDHPRWSQATERRLGEFKRRKTLPFNGYEKDVASLYRGMDLVKNF
ncbi:MAG: mononuclear molybdenum enzyme YedY [Desulfobulbaceae bacterium A2]|nr:MAG: mononuclear molybdenum enzyme YedY [Desulfobulbaceae bacterium A2]